MTIPDHVPADLHQPATAPDYTRAEILEFARLGHDHTAPESRYSRALMALVGVEMQRGFCRHCRPAFRLRPNPGTTWSAEWYHADACPDGDAP